MYFSQITLQYNWDFEILFVYHYDWRLTVELNFISVFSLYESGFLNIDFYLLP